MAALLLSDPCLDFSTFVKNQKGRERMWRGQHIEMSFANDFAVILAKLSD